MRNATGAAMLALALLLPAAACAPREAGAGPGAPKDSAGLAGICEDPASSTGTTITMQGRFQGYRVSECRFPACARATGLTRSDWLFQSGGECFYVTGGSPPGIDAVDPSAQGRGIELTAEVSRDDTGKLYLKYGGAKLLDG